ncbi:GTP-binding protein [Candidatus Woesearchaeota archaeon]|nr:GTP-binding protein [Candidatus Woesearchaeota archaeon]
MAFKKKRRKEAQLKEFVAEQKKLSTADKIKELEQELAKTKYNKRTQMHIGLVKAKIAKLREKQETSSSKGKKGAGYTVRKTGDGTVILVGFPSVGKSTLQNALTGIDSPIAAYEFTTLDVIPGILEHKYAKIQILDVPGIVHGAAAGTGRGKEVLAVMRNADLAVIIVDATRPEHFDAILKEIRDAKLRLDQLPPDVKITKTGKGGIRIGTTVKLTKMTKDMVAAISKEFGINNADIVIRQDIDEDQFIDVIEANRKYLPSVVILNKIDLIPEEKLDQLREKIKPDLCISAHKKELIPILKNLVFERLSLIRIFLKEIGKPPDMEVPLIMFKNCTVRDVCEKLHKDFVSKFKFARIWGKSAKFGGQKILKTEHVLQDEDILEIHLR